MKRIALLFCLIPILSLAAHAQSSVRYNYSLKGITHISADYELVDNGKGLPFSVRLENLQFPDGTEGYLVHMILKGKNPIQIPKGTKMTVSFGGTKTARLEQIGDNDPNIGNYLAEPYDIQQMADKIAFLDIATGYGPDDYVKIAFSGDEFSQVIRRQYELIWAAREKTIKIDGNKILGISDGAVSTRVVAVPIVAQGNNLIYNIGLTCLSYKEKESEDFDLSIQLGTDKKYLIPYSSEVTFSLKDGSQLLFKQHGDGVNRVVLYPTVAEMRKMIDTGISSMVLHTDEGNLTETFPGNDLSEVINREYQLLMSVLQK